MSTDLILGRLVSRVVEDHSLPITEGGFFELNVEVDMNKLRTEEDKRGYINRTIGLHLATAVIDTELPRDKWGFEPSPWLRKHFDYPEFLSFGGPAA